MIQIVNANLGNEDANIANAICEGATIDFRSIMFNRASSFNGRKSNKVIVLLCTEKDGEGSRFSLTRNNARFCLNCKEMPLDTADMTGLVKCFSGKGNDVLDAWKNTFGDFTKFNLIRVKFGTAVHFLNSDNEIIKTILRVESITEGAPDPTPEAPEAPAPATNNRRRRNS